MEIQNLAGYWHMPPDPVDLPENAVHLWSVNLEWASNSLQDIGKNLTADEQARAACIRCLIDRKYFIAARGVLRDILSRYICQAPIDIDLSYGLYGKPQVAALMPHFPNPLQCFPHGIVRPFRRDARRRSRN